MDIQAAARFALTPGAAKMDAIELATEIPLIAVCGLYRKMLAGAANSNAQR
jgi:hypothetical protein